LSQLFGPGDAVDQLGHTPGFWKVAASLSPDAA
jgi:hypothetical protein